MFLFQVKCGIENIRVQSYTGMLCVTHCGKSYLVEHCSDDGWLLKLGKMPADTFVKITDAIEEHVIAA